MQKELLAFDVSSFRNCSFNVITNLFRVFFFVYCCLRHVLWVSSYMVTFSEPVFGDIAYIFIE
jgi:hypothetical protein